MLVVGLLLSGRLLTGFGGTVAPAVISQGGAGKKKRRDWEQAQAEWNAQQAARKHWEAEARAWLEGEESPQPAKPVQAAQDAPKGPRKATPAISLAGLLERVQDTPAGLQLMRAMVGGDVDRIARAAYAAHVRIRQNEEAMVLILLAI